MKKQLWQKAIVGTLFATSLAAPIALAQTTDSLNATSAGQAQLVDHRGEGGKYWGHHRDSRHQGKRQHQGGENLGDSINSNAGQVQYHSASYTCRRT